MRFVFLGPPGVGKGTQAKGFAAQRGIAHISTGDMLRDAVKNGTPAGLKAKPIMEAGGLVPDDVVLEMVGERLEYEDAKPGFILDGYPRNPKQAEDLRVMLEQRGLALDHVVAFELDVEAIVPRLSGRRSCPQCGAVYHVAANPPKRAGVCDKCDTGLIQRKDDQPEVIRDRMKTYAEKTEPLIDYYRKAGILIPVEGAGTVEEVRGRLEAAVPVEAA